MRLALLLGFALLWAACSNISVVNVSQETDPSDAECPIVSEESYSIDEGMCQDFSKEELLATVSSVIDHPSRYGFTQEDIDVFLGEYGLAEATKEEILDFVARFIDEGYPHRHAAQLLSASPKETGGTRMLLSVDSPKGFVTNVPSSALKLAVEKTDGTLVAEVPFSLTPVTDLAAKEPAFAFSFVLDYSGSMYDCDLGYTELALNELMDTMPVVYEASLFKFNSTVCRIVQFTPDPTAVSEGLHQQIARGSTALYDGIIRGAKEVAERKPAYKFVLTVTDGMENASRNGFDDVLSTLHDANATPIIIGLGQVDIFNLNRIADESNGYFFYVPASSLLERASNSIAEAIGSAYEISIDLPYAEMRKITLGYTLDEVTYQTSISVAP